MTPEEFEKLVAEALEKVPEKFAKRLKNVAILVEDAPSNEVRKEEGLEGDETLLGLYRGIPQTERGEYYGVGGTLPDTITLYRSPILATATAEGKEVAEVVRDTVWHEIAHYFGFDEHSINEREDEGSNRY
jgi:predicted Zn-dependent protease with MMP-like domain